MGRIWGIDIMKSRTFLNLISLNDFFSFLSLLLVFLPPAILFISISSQASTSLRIPVLITNQKAEIFQTKDFAKILDRAQINIPSTIDLNLLTDSEDINQIESQVDILSQVTAIPLRLIKTAHLKTFVSANLENKLCYVGNKEFALRLFPQFTNDLFAADMAWLGYRFSGESVFRDFETSDKMDLNKVVRNVSLDQQVQWLTTDLKTTDIQILTQNRNKNSTSTTEMQVVSICK